MDVSDNVAACFREAFSLPADFDVTGLAYREHPAWTSLGHMTLVAELENRFDIIMDADDIVEMSNHQKVVDMMKKYSDAN